MPNTEAYQLENQFSRVIACEEETRPAGVEKVQLRLQLDPISLEWRPVERAEEEGFRTQLLALIERECATYNTGWRNPQGAPVRDFAGFRLVEKYLSEIWIYPSRNSGALQPQDEWIFFAYPAGAF
jgi:hypothetical protein